MRIGTESEQSEFRDEGLSVRVDFAAPPHVTFSGQATPSDPTALSAFLDGVHQSARARRIRLVVVDLRQLEFMNSTGLKPLIRWVRQLADLPPEAQYRIAFTHDGARRWQKASLNALACFAPAQILLENRGG